MNVGSVAVVLYVGTQTILCCITLHSGVCLTTITAFIYVVKTSRWFCQQWIVRRPAESEGPLLRT